VSRLRRVHGLPPAALVLLLACGCAAGRPAAVSSPAVSAPAPASGSASPDAGRARTAQAWRPGPDLPVAVSEVAVAVLGTDVHVLGGYRNGRPHSTTHLVLDTTAGRWRTAAPLDHIAGAAVGGRLYAVGGYGGAGPTDAAYSYDPATDRWSAAAPLPSPRAAATAAVLDGRLHVVGGKGPGGDTGEHDVLDPATGRWSTAAPMPTARDHAAAAVVAGHRPVAHRAAAAARPVLAGRRVVRRQVPRAGRGGHRGTTHLP